MISNTIVPSFGLVESPQTRGRSGQLEWNGTFNYVNVQLRLPKTRVTPNVAGLRMFQIEIATKWYKLEHRQSHMILGFRSPVLLLNIKSNLLDEINQVNLILLYKKERDAAGLNVCHPRMFIAILGFAWGDFKDGYVYTYQCVYIYIYINCTPYRFHWWISQMW